MAKSSKTLSTPKQLRNPGMMFVISFVSVTIVNAVVFFFANAISPAGVVLGNMSLSMNWATFLAAATLSLITVLALPFLTEIELQRRRNLSPLEMMGVYFFINFIGLWLITRASDVFGLGVSSWFIVLILAVVLDFIQGAVMMAIEKMKMSMMR